MLSMLEPAEPNADPIAFQPQSRRLSEHLKALSQLRSVADCLFRAPPISGVPNNSADIGASSLGNLVLRQPSHSFPWLALRCNPKAP
jgi:hypothetical protein